MKKGFTLAEVLITLAVIGIVAAITIPSIITKIQNHQFYTQFMKAYNTLSKVIQIIPQENFDYKYISKLCGTYNFSCIYPKIFGGYFNIQESCFEDQECYIKYNNSIYKFLDIPLDDNPGFYQEIPGIDGTRAMYTLSDNMFLGITCDNGGCNFLVDTNGIKKGPNTMGRDIFPFVTLKVDGVQRVFPWGLNKCKANDDGEYFLREVIYYPVKCVSLMPISLDEIINDDTYSCSVGSGMGSEGLVCGARLLLEGKMNY